MVIDEASAERIRDALRGGEPPEPARKRQARFFDALLDFAEPLAMVAPIALAFKITASCNFRCSHCWAYPATHTTEPSHQQILRLFSEADDLGVLKVVLSGGEPLLRHDITELVEDLKRRRMVVEIFTNGSSRVINALTSVLSIMDPLLDMVQISLDGGNMATHLKQRIGATTQDFETLREATYRCRATGITTRINMTATPLNVEEIVDAFALASLWGADVFRVNPFVPIGRAERLHAQNFEAAYLDAIAECVQHAAHTGTRFDFAAPIAFFADPRPFLGQDLPGQLEVANITGGATLEILPNGDTYPGAASIYEPSLLLGNVFRDTLMTVWNSVTTRVFRTARILTNTPCAHCAGFDFCRGGSAEKALVAFGSIDAPDPSCPRSYGEAHD